MFNYLKLGHSVNLTTKLSNDWGVAHIARFRNLNTALRFRCFVAKNVEYLTMQLT